MYSFLSSNYEHGHSPSVSSCDINDYGQVWYTTKDMIRHMTINMITTWQTCDNGHDTWPLFK